jgi:hypothetical protein
MDAARWSAPTAEGRNMTPLDRCKCAKRLLYVARHRDHDEVRCAKCDLAIAIAALRGLMDHIPPRLKSNVRATLDDLGEET